MKLGSSSGAGIPERTLDLSFGFNDPNFSDRLLLIEIIGDALSNQNRRRSNRVQNVKRRSSGDLVNNASIDTTLPSPPPLKTLHINSLILAARSPFFHKLFSNGMQESEQKHATLRIEALEEVSFMNLLKYVYSNILPTALNALLDLLVIADKFEVASCSMDCTRALQDMPMTSELASFYFDLPPSIRTSPIVQPLVDAAKQFLVDKFEDFHKLKEEVLNLPLLGFQAVISGDYLRVTSEIVVYECVLEWARKHYPDLEERREILKTHLLHLVRFPFMTTTELLKEVQTCNDIDPELASKIVIRALSFKAETNPHRRRCLATEADDTISPQFVERAYVNQLVKVIELELPHPQCVVYFDLRKDELKHIYPEGTIRSEAFHLGEEELWLSAICSLGIPSFRYNFWLDLDVSESSTCSVEYEFSLRKKPREDFVFWFAGSHAFTTKENHKNLHCEEWTGFVGNDMSHFINDILHVRAVLTIKK